MSAATPEFRALLDKIISNILPATRKIIAEGTQHQPMIMMFDHQGWLREAMLVEMGDGAEKDDVAAIHRMMATRPSIGCAILLTESWIMMMDPDDRPKIKGSLEHVPGRTEALLLSARKGTMHLFAMYPIERPADGPKGSTLGEPKIMDIGDPTKAIMAGRFVDNDEPHTTH